jgi:LysR family hydrogen peroxide-inducible transcriptional activator
MNRLAPHPLSLRQLQYALAVAETRSFRRAAELCLVSQPSLSAQLAQLERALGVRLFERDRRGVLPTPAGEELVDRARRVLLEADDLLATAKRLTDPLSGTLRVGVIPTISPYLLPAAVPLLRAREPKLTLQWIEDRTGALIERLRAGTLDAALLALVPDTQSFEHEVVGDDPFMLAAPRDHELARLKRPVALRELDREPVLLLDDGHCLRDQALEVCTRARARELDFRATSLATLAQMVASGAGVTLLPRLAVPTETRRADLAVRALAAPAPKRTLAVIWRPRSPLEAAARAIAAVLKDAMREASGRTKS